MKNAARVTDPHSCPAHGAGSINPPCFPTVVIGGLPAARVTDQAQCTGATDTIATGADNVKIGGLDAAIVCSTTLHNGRVTNGCINVFLAPSTAAVNAAATRTPTAAEVAQIEAAIAANQFQQAIDLTKTFHGIDTSNVPNGVVYSATIPRNPYGDCSLQGDIRVGPPAMRNAPMLASTIVHETSHANQAAVLRSKGRTAWGNLDLEEVLAYDSEFDSAHETGYDQFPGVMASCLQTRATHFGRLTAADLAAFCSGSYSG